MRRQASSSTLVLTALALTLLAGCGDPQNRQEITGQVTLKGKPVEVGIIQFIPLDGQPTSDGAQIIDGRFRIPREKGLAPGKYRVTIHAGNAAASGEGDGSPDAPKGGLKPPGPRIPAEYNTHSKLVKEVVDSGPNHFDFPIP